MDHGIIKKKLSTFKSSKGNLIKVSDEVLFEVIRVWETWTGSSTDLARELGVHVKQLSFLVRKAKALHREGRFPENEFKEIKVESTGAPLSAPCCIELCWDQGKVIRFAQVEHLVDFLKKAA